ncbi:hypothetical protein F4802DRAFT_488793 [Xylaria palmicola]|nr:hypothetical protein F4802DRAFT_488793 [Xylaria palmicola]
MSYRPNPGTGAAGNYRPSYGPPPLPPRNNGPGLIASSDAVAPPIPPRPSGFGHQPVRQPGRSETPSQPTSSSVGVQRKPVPNNFSTGAQATISPEQSMTPGSNGYQQYQRHPSAPPGTSPNQTQGYTDIAHLFPDGKVPPPPPMPVPPGVSLQMPSTASLAAFKQQISVNGNSQGAYYEGGQLQNHSEQPLHAQEAPAPGSSQQHVDSTNTNFHGDTKHQIVDDGIMQGVPHPPVQDNVAVISEGFQAMQLGDPSQAPAPYRGDENDTRHRVYSPRNPDPTPANVPPPTTRQTPSARSPAPETSAVPPGQQQQPMAKECIATGVTFAATWYTHPRAPEFPICMNCYENQIRGSRFRSEFVGVFRDDGKPLACLFNSTRIKDRLWDRALASGSLDELLDYLVRQPFIPGCVGPGGAKGDAGIKWYRTRDDDIPGMVVCQACYEDHVLAYPEFGTRHFMPNTAPQAADQTWSCDLVVPYIYREYKARAMTNDWPSFVASVPVRLSFKPCPGEETVYPDGSGRRWFTPVGGPQGLLICAACYCDYVLLTGQDGRWQDAGGDLVSRFGVSVSCFFGAQFNVRALAARVLDTFDQAQFWRAMDVVINEPRCKGRIQSSAWYTLRADPPGFEVCRACHATIAEPMGVGHYFVPKAGVPPGSDITCSFNPGIARFPIYMQKLLEMVYKQDPAPLEAFVRTYAFMPECRRDTRVENASWFGWDECTVCAECHHEFVRGTALAGAMPHQGTQVAGGVMCEMYSPRMRQLYLDACAAAPPDPRALLEHSARRRAVWAETVPRARRILSDIRLNIARQSMAINNSMFYSFSGNLWQNTLPLEQTYSGSAIGPGHYNHMQVKGAEWGQQATAIGNEIRGAPADVADELMRRWRLVE